MHSYFVTLMMLLLTAGPLGCGVVPSNARNWSPDQAVLAHGEFDGDLVTLHNVRNCEYRTASDYKVRYYTRTYDLRRIRSVDFVMVPFAGLPGAAHTFLSFGFEGKGRLEPGAAQAGDEPHDQRPADEYVAVSVEIRKEEGETYSFAKGIANGYELMYVLGDERDLIGLRANHRLDDVYVYRANATPEQARALLVDVIERANKLRAEPEFYNLVSNNCTTNVMQHVNKIARHPIAYNYQVMFPGYADRLAYDLGLIRGRESFERTKLEARVNRLAYVHRESAEFSSQIRR